MIVFRLAKTAYSKDLSGRGAEKYGGRWNGKGIPMVYTASSRALAVAEVAVHTPLGIIPEDYQLAIIFIPDNLPVKTITEIDLPENWPAMPFIKATRLIGNDFIKQNEHPVLQVPSACVQGDVNYLINPLHEQAVLISIQSVEHFRFDSRLFLK